ncbi:cation transport ATPase-like protein [Nitrosomonas communis]|uniref:Cation transport ATPase-like protein n=2 Tax=Nitrosomonadaceae TaxID=206379 RepID=A0A0F7KI38_9PROT|nr:hypothetical protein AAW31_13030 [Nitrosomonas communis]TYP89247.1 cation transport ATPase-like protein [Nitrosomonas communis]
MQTEAEQRFKQYGLNRLRPPRKRSAWIRLFKGDHITIARAVGMQLGIEDGQMALNGSNSAFVYLPSLDAAIVRYSDN